MKKNFESALGKVVFGIVLSLLGIFMILYSRTFPKVRSGGDVMTGPSFFPTIIGILMIAFGIYTIILNLLSRKNLSEELKNNDNSFFKSREFFNFLIFVLFIAIYPTVINVLGFFIGTFLFCFILMRRLQAKWIRAILSSLILVIFTWIIFTKVAFISLPMGIIFTGR
jgi:putative tricarboxylic transport membrane protein